jgi:parvulin-like peptidyl-prolyl isomerase
MRQPFVKRQSSLLPKLRGGADFQKLAVENSDKPDVATTKGKVDTFDVKELDPKFANAIKGLNKGSVY